MLKPKAAWKLIFAGLFALSTNVKAQDEVMQDEMAQEEVEEVPVLVLPEQTPYFFADIPEELLIDRLKCLQKEVKLVYNPKIKGFIDYFTIKNRKYLTTMEARRNIYFPLFEEYLKKHGMPDELKYLSIVESGLNPKAVSRAGAAGLWQFMPSTGKIYDLNQDFYIDDRLDPHKATEAACKYLKQLYNMFNDWELALASYNCGPGNVRRAIRKSGYKETFWEIYNYLPAETRGYVPQFVAVTYVMNYLRDYGLDTDLYEYAMAFDTVSVNATIDINKLADALEICKEDIDKLNPALKRDVLPGNRAYTLKIPADVADKFRENRLAMIEASAITVEDQVAYEEAVKPSKTYHVVKKGDYLGKIADKYNVSMNDIKKWNNLKGSTIHSGQKLVIYSKTPERAAIAQKTSAPEPKPAVAKSEPSSKQASTPASEPKKSTYVVKSGDNLNKIASANGVSVEDLKKWNDLNSSTIHAGQKLVIVGAEGNKQVAQAPRSAPKVYYVQPGDTLWSISKKYEGISVEDIKKKNNLKNENIKPGMKLIIG